MITSSARMQRLRMAATTTGPRYRDSGGTGSARTIGIGETQPDRFACRFRVIWSRPATRFAMCRRRLQGPRLRDVHFLRRRSSIVSIADTVATPRKPPVPPSTPRLGKERTKVEIHEISRFSKNSFSPAPSTHYGQFSRPPSAHFLHRRPFASAIVGSGRTSARLLLDS